MNSLNQSANAITADGATSRAVVAPRRVSLKLRLINIAAVVLPFLGVLTAIILLWGVAFNWVYLAILGGMYIASALGITIGFHRLFTHRSFSTSRPVAAVLAVLGSMAIEGPLFQWVATHRRHHQSSDHGDDPHSPHTYGAGFWNTIRGLWHAHMGWLFSTESLALVRHRTSRARRGNSRYVADLRKDPLLRWLSRTFPIWAALGLVIPAALGGLITLSWMGVLLGFIWGGLVRVFLVHHVTWSINSVCHIWGSRPFRSHDESRNNLIFGVLALGEGWHNNHHAFPTSARHGLRWWQLDITYLVIRVMALTGLAQAVRIPSPERVAAKRRVEP